MQILRIRFKNINSLKGEHTIDFTQQPLSSAGLFAITGDTGSGKTTILDVITLALFSRIPRVSEAVTKGFIEKSGLVLTRNTPEAMAEVTYACNEGTFTSQWSIGTNRNGKLKECDMQISDDADKLLPLKKSEVAACNESYIGLNFEQFVKAIILAQGDFAAFLKAKKDERGHLLEKVTGTWIYRQLGRLAYQKNRTLGQKLEILQAQQSTREEQLMPEEEYAALIESLKETDQQLTDGQERIKMLSQYLTIKAEIATLSQTVKKQRIVLDAARGKLHDFSEKHGEPMKKHARLQPWQEQLWEWRNQQKNLSDLQTRLGDIEAHLLHCGQQDSAIREEVRAVTGSEDAVATALDNFQKKVLDLEKKLSETESVKRNVAKSVQLDARALIKDLDVTDPDRAKSQLREMETTNGQQLREISALLSKEAITAPDDKLREMKKAADSLQALVSERRFLHLQQQQLQELTKNTGQIKEELAQIPLQIDDTRTKQKEADLILQGLFKDKTIRDLTASLEEHRKKLLAGEPCPLCGATEHPFSHGIPSVQDDLDKEIKAAQETNDQLKKTLTTLEVMFTDREKSLGKNTREQLKLDETIKLSTDRCNTLQASLPQIYSQEEPQAAIKRVKQDMDNIELFRSAVEKDKKLKALLEKVGEWHTYFLSAAGLSEELKRVFPGKDVLGLTRDLFNRFTQNNTRRDNMQEEKKILTDKHLVARETFETLTGWLSRELDEYPSPGEAIKDLMKDAEYKALQLQRDNLHKEIGETDSALKVHEKNLEVLQEKDMDNTTEELQTQHKQAIEQLDEFNRQRDILMGRKTMQEKTIGELRDLKTEIDEQKKQNEKWYLLNKYIGDAEGKRFSTFAQELTLLQLVGKASKRLELLNERYRLSIPKEGEDDSLVVVDTHMGDMRRSVKSLSGGETFLVSLALALALSDLAAHKVEIKSLFIDEGFGSLDKLTLDQTMDTLEKLQYETNKTIGVISHVEAMQERITTQIQLEKGGQGNSTIRIV